MTAMQIVQKTTNAQREFTGFQVIGEGKSFSQALNSAKKVVSMLVKNDAIKAKYDRFHTPIEFFICEERRELGLAAYSYTPFSPILAC